jgi:hypothetical protein
VDSDVSAAFCLCCPLYNGRYLLSHIFF